MPHLRRIRTFTTLLWACLGACTLVNAALAARIVTGEPTAGRASVARAGVAVLLPVEPPAPSIEPTTTTTAAPTTTTTVLPTTTTTTRSHARAAARPKRTSCTSVAHIGDSLSLTMTNPNTPAAQQMEPHYRRVGVQQVVFDVEGGRSVVEVVHGKPNGYDTAVALRQQGFRGCWVVALGTNDAANVARGSSVGLRDRVARMMSVIGKDPVLFVNARTTAVDGWWAEPNMVPWNAALAETAPRHPSSMRIFDWAAVAQPEWFTKDGIHNTSLGSAHRASLTADALVEAFPG